MNEQQDNIMTIAAPPAVLTRRGRRRSTIRQVVGTLPDSLDIDAVASQPCPTALSGDIESIDLESDCTESDDEITSGEEASEDAYQVVRLLPKVTTVPATAEPMKRIHLRRVASAMPCTTRLSLNSELGLPLPTLKHRSSFIDPLRAEQRDKCQFNKSPALLSPKDSNSLTRQAGMTQSQGIDHPTIGRGIFDWQAHGFDKGTILDANFQAVKKDRYLMTVTLKPDIQSTYRLSVSSLQRAQILQDLVGTNPASTVMAAA